MQKCTTRKRRVNGKLIFYKPFIFYFSVLIVIFYIILILPACLYAAVEIAVGRTACPTEFSEKNELGYQNTSEYDTNGVSNKTCINYNKFSKVSPLLEVLLFISSPVLVLLFLLYTFRRISFGWVMLQSKLNAETAKQISDKRKRYLELETRDVAADAELQISKLLNHEIPAIFSGLNHSNLMLNPHPRTDIYYNLKWFMLHTTWKDMPGHLPPFIDIVIFTRDILNGLQYLHDHQIYHLNICPENILIVKYTGNASGIAKISGFEFAEKSDQCTVDYQKVGLGWIYRPPEYYAEGTVDAAAVDCWSVGITAYEILTGGMITIYTEKKANDQIHKLIEEEKLLELNFFSSAVDASWKYTRFIGGFNNIVRVRNNSYNLSPLGFLKDSWSFVTALMQIDPNQRPVVSEVLKHPFIINTINPVACWCNTIYPNVCYNSQESTEITQV